MPKINVKLLKIIIYIFLAACLLISLCIIYRQYLKPRVRLDELLPNDYQIAIELDFCGPAFSYAEEKKLLSNELAKNIFSAVKIQFNNYLETLPEKGRNAILNSPHLLFFLKDNNQFGLIFQPKNKKQALGLTEADFKPLLLNNYQNKYLIISNNQNLLSTAKDKKIKAKINPYLSLTLNPWLKIGINNSFFLQQDGKPFLAELQQAFLPLKQANSYEIKANMSGNNLNFTLKPNQPENLNGFDFGKILNYLNFNSYLTIGLADFEELEKYLSDNQNVRGLWEKLDQNLFLNSQHSLSHLKKLAQPPIMLGFSKDGWQIFTNISNLALAQDAITGYLAQFYAKEQIKILPDGTKSVELLADPGKVRLEKTETNKWRINFESSTAAYGLGWAENGKSLIISNNITKLSEKTPLINCGLNNLTNPLAGFFFLKSDPELPFSPILLDNFNYLGGYYYPNGEIKLCIGLK